MAGRIAVGGRSRSLAGLGAAGLTFTVRAPVLRSPLDLNVVVDRVKDNIEAGGNWQVVSYSVTSGSEGWFSWILPSSQGMKWILRRTDGGGDQLGAQSIVAIASAKEGLTLAAVKDWFVEVSGEVVAPSIPTAPKVCDVIGKAMGVSCTTVKVGAVAIGGGVLLVAFREPIIDLYRALRGRRRRR